MEWEFNNDGKQFEFKFTNPVARHLALSLQIETVEQTAQFPDGRITFSSLDAKIEGQSAKLESQPGNHRIRFAPGTGDAVGWDFKPTRWGRYDLELAYASDGADSELQIDLAGQTLVAKCPSTHGSQRYATLNVERFYLAKSEPFTLRVTCKKLDDQTAFNLKAVTLRPAPEGVPITQEASGVVTLAASNAITHSVLMRYEPATNKNCLGYWANVNDWAEWKFALARPGEYEVEVWQGCGKGQGGSDVAVEVGEQRFEFVVEDTGHFQNFVPRKIGRVSFKSAGNYSLVVKPKRKQAGAVMDIRQVRLLPVNAATAPSPLLQTLLAARRVVFLGDSITYAGEWVEFVEAYVRMKFPKARVEFLDLGLPSETASGLSEPGHAGGAFPRPDVHERLGRVLEKAKPNLIVACYGMNDGIYYPLGEERFLKFQDGHRRLRERATVAGAQVIHVTPPTFDAVPLKGHTLPAGLAEYRSPFEGYNEVLDRYSEWLLTQRTNGWQVIDAHGPMNRFLAEHRRGDPKFLLAGDGVHANTQGHWLIAREFLRELGAAEEINSSDSPDALLKLHPHGAGILKLIQQRQRVLKDAWLTHIGHVRPGMNKGKPLADAEREAAELTTALRAIL